MKTLLTNGNSWTFGSDLNSPHVLHPEGPGKGIGRERKYLFNFSDTSPENDYYRVPKIWPTKLAKLLSCKNINLAWPARSNEIICSSTIGWVLDYLNKGGSPADLIVVIGWGGAEWKHVLIKQNEHSNLSDTIWPEATSDRMYKQPVLKEYFHLYRNHLNVEQEFITRYVESNFILHLFLKKHSIKHLFFNAFWTCEGIAKPHVDVDLPSIIQKWRDSPPINNLEEKPNHQDEEVDRVLNMWNEIPTDILRFKSTLRSFRWFIEHQFSLDAGFTTATVDHPTPASHLAWAQYLKSIL
jgi:hypothetical protein